jgi:hypothetical protein
MNSFGNLLMNPYAVILFTTLFIGIIFCITSLVYYIIILPMIDSWCKNG